MPEPKTRITFELSASEIEALRAMADRRGTTVTELLRYSLNLIRDLEQRVMAGSHFIERDKLGAPLRMVEFTLPGKDNR